MPKRPLWGPKWVYRILRALGRDDTVLSLAQARNERDALRVEFGAALARIVELEAALRTRDREQAASRRHYALEREKLHLEIAVLKEQRLPGSWQAMNNTHTWET